MSRYSGECDFRDDLEIFYDDDFEKFMKGTEGKVSQYTVDGERKEIVISCPADLIPLYPYPIAVMSSSKDDKGLNHCFFLLSHNLSNWGKKSLDNELKELYEIEKIKPVEEQSII